MRDLPKKFCYNSTKIVNNENEQTKHFYKTTEYNNSQNEPRRDGIVVKGVERKTNGL